jgi:RimJ/RimL family protein N-acetyltransferase
MEEYTMSHHYFWKGQVVQLRQHHEQDVERKLEEYYDSDARSHLQNGITDLPPVSPERYRSLLKLEEQKHADTNLHEPLDFAIENLDKEFAGWVNIWQRDPRSGTFTFGVSIFREYRQRGYASDAIKIILRYGFYELRMQKCNSGCRSDNLASIKLHQSLGFKEEGRIRRNIFTNNQFYDLLYFGLLKEEFTG